MKHNYILADYMLETKHMSNERQDVQKYKV